MFVLLSVDQFNLAVQICLSKLMAVYVTVLHIHI